MILLQIFVITHLIGMSLMAGTTVVEYITAKNISKIFREEREKALGLLELMKKFAVLLGLGAALLIISGTGLLIINKGVFFHQLWFKIKLLLIVILILNGFLVGNRQELKLKKSMNGNGTKSNEQIKKAIVNIRVFYLTQMALFFIIIILAVFK